MIASSTRTKLAPLFSTALFFALNLFPLATQDPYWLHLMILLFLSVIMGASWNIVGGFTGQYSVGHAAYFGIGAYVTLILLQYRQIAPWWGSLIAIAVALLVAVIIGSITFRLQGPYFVLASIAVAEIIRLLVLNYKDLTNGAEGILISEIPTLRIAGRTITDFATKVPFFYIGLFLAAIVTISNKLISQSKLGYYFQAIREDQNAANSLGINISLYKNLALAISAVFTACAGSFYGLYIGFIDPQTVFGVDLSVQIVLICIIGGIGTVPGPVVGSLVLVPLSEALRSNLLAELLINFKIISDSSAIGLFIKENLAHAHVLIYGILVVVVILFMPEGVLGFASQKWSRRASAMHKEALE